MIKLLLNLEIIKMRNIIIVILSILLTSGFAQEKITFTKEISESVDSVLNAYAKYATFTEDNIKISEYYVSQFKSIFVSENSIVLNDLKRELLDETKAKELFSTNLSKYIDYAKDISNRGFNIKLTNIIQKEIRELYKNKYLITVSFDKNIKYITSSNVINRKITEIYMDIVLDKSKDKSSYKIKEIYNCKGKLIKSTTNSNKEINIAFIPSFNNIKIKGGEYNIQNKGSFVFDFQLNFIYFFKTTRKYALGSGLGLNFAKYKGSLSIDQLEESGFSAVDSDDDEYILHSQMKDIKDDITYSFNEIEFILIKYRKLGSKKGWSPYASLGFELGFIGADKNKISGKIKNQGEYNGEFIGVLDQVDFYNFSNTFQDFEEKNTSFMKPVNYGFFANFGISKIIANKLLVSTGLSAQYSIAKPEMQNTFLVTREPKNNTNVISSINSLGTLNILTSLGWSIGLSYFF